MKPKVRNLETPIEGSEGSLDLRSRILDVLAKSGRGHLGPALSILDIVDALYESVLKYDANNTNWEHRDRFVLSKGHGCLGLYVVLEKHGFFHMRNWMTFVLLNHGLVDILRAPQIQELNFLQVHWGTDSHLVWA